MQNKADFVVTLEGGGSIRLDKYCAQVCGIARSRLKNGLISVEVDGKPAKLSKPVKAGSAVSLLWADPVPESIEPENIPLDILFENNEVTVINKKSGMVVHPAAGNWSGTLVNALLFHWRAQGINAFSADGASPEAARPGIVHRLDKDTSGVMIAARNPCAAQFLQNEFKAHRARKIYAAILCGSPPEKRGVVENVIFRDPKNRLRFSCAPYSAKACAAGSRPAAGKRAKTAYKVIAEYGDYSLALFRIYTGRTHQIRVHSRYLGCPVLGDPLYGKQAASLPMMLHSLSLSIRLPGEEAPSVFRAPLPEHFKNTLRALKCCGKPVFLQAKQQAEG